MALRVPGSGREVFTELKNRGVEDVFVAVCDGVKGLLEVISTTWEKTVVQQCIAPPDPQQHRDAIVRSLKPVYTAPSEAVAKDRFAEFAAERGTDIRRSSSSGAISWAQYRAVPRIRRL